MNINNMIVMRDICNVELCLDTRRWRLRIGHSDQLEAFQMSVERKMGKVKYDKDNE